MSGEELAAALDELDEGKTYRLHAGAGTTLTDDEPGGDGRG